MSHFEAKGLRFIFTFSAAPSDVLLGGKPVSYHLVCSPSLKWAIKLFFKIVIHVVIF